MKIAVHFAFAVLLAGFTVAGCGGGGSESSDHSSGSASNDSGSHSTATGGTSTGTTSGASATLSGTINLTGTPPAPSKLKMGADPVCAGAHEDMPAFSQDVLVNDSGMLQNVFVYVKNGLEGEEFDTPEEPVVMDQKGCMYSPHVFGMMAGQDLKILNSDPTLHNIHALPKADGNKEFNLGMPRQGMEFSKTFAKPEVMVRVKCDVHPWMGAYVGVLSHPYYAVSGKNGTFKIADLPAGNYTIAAWHEKFGEREKSITVGDAPTVEVNFTFAAQGS